MRTRTPQVLVLLAVAAVCFLLWDDFLGPFFEDLVGSEADEQVDTLALGAGAGPERHERSGGPSLEGAGGEVLLGPDGRPLSASAQADEAGVVRIGGAGDVTFEGRVRDGDGAGAAEVKIVLQGPGGLVTLQTDASGAFEGALAPGRYKILFDGGDAGGLLLRQYMIDGAPKEDLAFTLREPGALNVEIKRGEDAVVGAPVFLTAVGLEDLVHLEGSTDQTGHALFEGLIPSRYELQASVPEGPTITQSAYASSGTARDVKLRVPGGVILKGKVVAGNEGPGIGGAEISLQTRDLRGTALYDTTFQTTADGTFEIMIPQGRPQSFQVLAEGYAPWPTPKQARSVLRSLRGLAAKKPVTRNVTLIGGAMLSGVVRTAEETPIPGVVLRFQAPRVDPISVTTQGDGRYSVASLNPGRYDLQVETPAYFPVSEQPLRVTIPGGESPRGTEFDVTLVGARRLEGLVIDGEEQGVPGARVFIVGGGGIVRSATRAGRLLETFSDASGRWVIADIPPNQNVTVRAKMGLEEATPVFAPWERPPPSPIKMRLEPTGTLAGRVVDIESRMSLPNVRIVLRPDPSDGRTGRTAFTNREGEYSLVGLLPGAWKVTPSRKDYLVAEPDVIQVTRGADVKAELRLDPGIVIAGTVTTDTRQPLRDARVIVKGLPEGAEKPITKAVNTDAKGLFRISGLKRGTYEITCWAKGYRAIKLPDVRSSRPELSFSMVKR